MAEIKINSLGFCYAGKNEKCLDSISAVIENGAFCVVCGASGSGKTTLLRLLKPEIAPKGKIAGSIDCGGIGSEQVGFVFQNPDSQIVTDKVWHELAFGLESQGEKTEVIRRRVAETAAFFGIEEWFYKNTSELSGGQKQLLNLASVMVTKPDILLLDEPCAFLDPIGAENLIKCVERINNELGTTIIMTEHSLDGLLGICSRLMVLDDGRIKYDGEPREVCTQLCRDKDRMFLSMPSPARAWANAPLGECPLNVGEGKKWLFEAERRKLADYCPQNEETETGKTETTVELCDAVFGYNRGNDVLKGIDFCAGRGKITAILGGNGAGKSTVLSVIAGINKLRSGKLKTLGRVSLLPQEPEALFSASTVFENLKDAAAAFEKGEAQIKDIAAVCDIENIFSSHPFDISGGEKQRAAIAMLLVSEPDVLLLDEPTKGLDNFLKDKLGKVLQNSAKQGRTVVLVSHDMEFCARYADECALMFDGRITSKGRTREFFCGNSFYTTPINRMASPVFPKAVLPEDIGKPTDKSSRGEEETLEKPITKEKHDDKRNVSSKKMLSVLSFVIPLLLVPSTILLSYNFFGDGKYLFISLLVILEILLPVFFAYENSSPKARDVVTVAALCAVAVAGRIIFSPFPQFKPMLALVLVSGIAFGKGTGFIVGAVSCFVSNMFFGQGTWTPWQMLAFGICGFAGGLLSSAVQKGRYKRIKICVLGMCSAIFLYGAIMDPASVLMFQQKIKLSMIASSYAVGFPANAVHALSTFIFLWFFSLSMLDKLDRLKVKYGTMQNRADY